MKQESLSIANGSAFWGDSIRASSTLLKQKPDLNFLTLDYLSELSLSIMAIQQKKDSSLGYAKDFIDVLKSLIPYWKKGGKCKVISNAGGLNPLGCAEACMKVLQQADLSGMKLGVVDGDDVLHVIKQDVHNPLYRNLETGESLAPLKEQLIVANAYLGAKSISDCLKEGAHIVITGRVADPSLTVGPCVYHYQWSPKNYNQLAQATIAGHLIECGTQVTGGISSFWDSFSDVAHIGFPFVEIKEDGVFVISKPPQTGGMVDERTVKEQLLYEIENPACYYSPDVVVSFLSLKLEEVGKDRIRVSGAEGFPPSDTFKVNAVLQNGYKAEGSLVIVGENAVQKGRLCGDILLNRVKEAGTPLEKTLVECIGAGDVVPGVFSNSSSKEIVLRVAARDKNLEALENFVKEFAPFVTNGPQGITGYATGRPSIRPHFAFWPCLIEKTQSISKYHLMEVP